MIKIRIQNKSKGGRGIYVAGEMVSIDAGATRTFNDMTSEEIAEVSGNNDFRVQRSVDGGDWEELSSIELPEARQWIAVATDADGSNFRKIALEPGEWYLGTAVASDEPDIPLGFDWAKIGGATDSAPLTEEAALTTGNFDPLEYLNQAAANLEFEGRSSEVLEALLEAEKSEAGKKRKGVVSQLEELLTEPHKE